MSYTLGKTFIVPGKSHALTGAMQYFTVACATADFDFTSETAAAQANALLLLEVLKTRGQAVITNIAVNGANSELKFTLEQANVWGEPGQKQISARDLNAEAVAAIKAALTSIKKADKSAVTFTVTVESAF